MSDLHFGLLSRNEEKKREESFVEFLKYCEKEAHILFILGDLFDYWFEYKRVIQKGYFKTFTALQNLVESGCKVHYFIGNHDFMHRDFFENEIGVILQPKEITYEFDGKKFFLGHGDGLVENDYGYLILKKILRNKFLQKLYSLIHPDLGIWLASSSSKTSREYTSNKFGNELDGLQKVAFEKINNGYDYVLFGHSHLVMDKPYKHGKYINLGTWLDEPFYAVYENGTLDIKNWNSNGKKVALEK